MYQKDLTHSQILRNLTMFFVGLSMYFAVQHYFFSSPSLDKLLMYAASEINKTCPIVVDEETQLDNTIALPDNVFQYNFTLPNLSKSDSVFEGIKKIIEPKILNSTKTSPDLKTFRDNKVTMNYNYRDKEGVFLFKIIITPEMYLNSKENQ
jgi:hypothetical protein